MNILIDKELLEKTLNTLRDVSVFMGQGVHSRAKSLLEDVLLVKNKVSNILIVNPDDNKKSDVHFVIRKDSNTFSIDDNPDMKIVERYGGRIVVKLAGHMETHGRGLRTYKEAEYQVWKITDIEDHGDVMSGHAHWVIDFPVNPKKQSKQIQHHRSTV